MDRQSRSDTSTQSKDLVRHEDLVEAFLATSRALVGVAARSLADLEEDVTLTQYRVLIELAAHGPLRITDLSAGLGVDSSTATRMCDRLVRKELVQRRRIRTDRRGVRVALSASGRDLVRHVSQRRRSEIAKILRRLPESDLVPVLEALHIFADAAGEVPEQDWSLGWDVDR